MRVPVRCLASLALVGSVAVLAGCATSSPKETSSWLVDFPIVTGDGAGSRWFTTSISVTENSDGTGVANMRTGSVVPDPCWAGSTDVRVAREGRFLIVTQPGKMSSCRTIQYHLPISGDAGGAVFVRPGLAPTAPFAQEPSIRNIRRG